MPQALTLVFVLARLAIVVALLPYALDWRSPALASVHSQALAVLIVVPAGLIVAELATLRRRASTRGVRALSGIALALSVLCVMSVLWFEAHFQWMRRQVL